MRSSEYQHSQKDLSNLQYKSTALLSDNFSSDVSSSSRPLTPDPSPSMNPEAPKNSDPKRLSPHASSTPNSPRYSTEKETALPNIKSFTTSTGHSKGKVNAPSSSLMSSPSLSSPSSARPLHSLYPNATPPMSPAHSLLSPASNAYQNSADHNQHSSGFYQLPPPLQSFKPHDAIRHSPTMSPQQSNQSGGSLSLPPPRSSHVYGISPRSNPQMSPRIHHSMSSPSIGPLSPYPTPQNHPQHQSSPHQSPRYESHQLKHSNPPSMSLPASSLSSTSVFQALPPRPYPSIPNPNGHTTSSSPSHGPMKSPRNSGSQRSAPNSPQRFMMLPPQTAPSMALARQSSTQSKSSSSTSTKRRASSGAKAVDQETREMMRKVSHSAIERRRRERINDKILQLKHLVPACIDEDHLHKLSILQSTIEYIQYLKSVIPESVANAKFQKATNNNPNNKTTDMLEALSNTSATMSFAPMMTTGLGYPYSKRFKSDQASTSETDTPVNTKSTNQSHDLRRSSAAQSSSDEDAKDGLLLLSQISSGALSANTSPNLAPERLGDTQTERNVDNPEYRGNKRRLNDNIHDDDDNDETFHIGSEDSDESEDDEDQAGEGADTNVMDDIQIKEGVGSSSRSSSKMSVEQMLC